MRSGLGYLSLLITIGIIVWVASMYLPATLEKGQEAHQQAVQISGRGPDGERAQDSVKLEPQLKAGKTDSLLVTDVTPGGALDQYFGLQKGDKIIQIGEFTVRDYAPGESMLEADVWEAGQRSKNLVVIRNGQTMTLTPKGGGLQNSVKIPLH